MPNASSYRVALSKAGATLASTTVTTPSWSPTVTTTPGNASLSVRAVVLRKPGKVATLSVPLADVTAPQGSYSSSWDNNTGIATIAEDSLSDNSGTVGITDGRLERRDRPEAWTTGATINHSYR